MNKKIYLLGLILGVLVSSCGGDEETFERPSVSAPNDVLALDYGVEDASVDFTVNFDPKLTATYEAIGTGVNVLNPTGEVTGSSISVNFDAGTSEGTASIRLIVTDSEGQTDDATAVFSIATKQTQEVLTSNITSNTTWTSDKVYILGGRITVVDGVTLTIEPGTVIKGEAGTGPNATALLVARGGTLMAEGTADAPIIFTSIADELSPEDMAAGNFASPNLDPDINGLWGGVIVLGKARISASNDQGDQSEVQIEGIPTSDPNGLYGGSDDQDNSGVLKYISIRHGGANIGAGNEINGLSLGGVGSGTVVENIEIVANQDDGVEWFGGTVNVKNVVVWNTGDDGIDTDQSWAGTLDNFVVYATTGHAFELDGPEGTMEAGHIIQNGTIIASDDELGRLTEDLINVDNNSIVDLKNIFFTGIKEGQKINRVTAEGVTFEGIVFDVAEADLPNHVNGDIPAGVTAGTTGTKADVSVFGWTWTAQEGKLADL
jgi:hypothetical protein